MKKKYAALFIAAAMLSATAVTGCSGSGKSAATTAAEESVDTADAEKDTAAAAEEAAAPEEQETLKVALVAPLTGENAQYGQQFERGVTEAVLDYNSKGGPQVTLDIYDDKNDAKEAVNIANMILADGDYLAILGPYSSTCGLAMAEVTDEEKMITISPSISHVDYVSLYDYTYRLSHINAYEGKVAADYLNDEWGCTKVAGMYSSNDWGITISDAFEERADELGLEVVADEAFIIGQTKDFSASLTKIRENGAEALFFMGQYTEAAAVLNQMKDMGMDDIKVLLCTSTKIETAELAPDACRDAVFLQTIYVDPSNEKVTEFANRCQEKYGCAIDSFLLMPYDAAAWLLAAYDDCRSTDPDVLAESINKLGREGIDGMAGYFTLGDDRNIERKFHHCKWNGKLGDEIGYDYID